MTSLGINVIVPLGGLGTRFQKEGYITRCKPFVPVLGKPMIFWVLDNLTLSENDALVIVYNPNYMGIGNFMREVVGIKYTKCKFVELPGPTRGAAETVLFGLKALGEEEKGKPVLLADGDTFYTCDIVSKFREVASTHNAVFCFHDVQPKPIYSYITLDGADDILEVKEKVKISDWANSGCYCFRTGSQLAAECEALIEANTKQASQDGIGEFYTSGVIAAMLEKKEPFRAIKLDVGDIHVLGTPAQVTDFCEQWPLQPRTRFVVDLEGVLIAGINGEPVPRNVETCRRLKEQGHVIIVHSTRYAGTEWQTGQLLRRHDIPYDELWCGKPRGDFYIGGPSTCDATLMELDKQIGFHPTQVKATKVNKGRSRPQVLKKAKTAQVSTLNPYTRGVNCVLKLLEDPHEAAEVPEGRGHFWEVSCGDASGKVTLSLTEAQWSDGLVKEKVVMIRNGFVKMVKGHMRLCIDKWGKVDLNCDETVDEVGSKDISAVEYERVPA